MKKTYDVKTDKSGYQHGDLVCLQVTDRIKDVIYLIQKSPREKLKVYFNRLAPYGGSNEDVSIRATLRNIQPPNYDPSFEKFMFEYFSSDKGRHGVVRNLFRVPADFCLAHCVAQDLQMSKGITAIFRIRTEGWKSCEGKRYPWLKKETLG